ncbi:MAG TPA: HD domain-containing protein [Bacteroidia bacterium]|nr:HD domain-containing protein [Bacteroidia bacterium]
MDYSSASRFMLKKLESELPSYCFYHDYAHTLDVLAAVETLAREESITDTETVDLMRTAAVYHDCGFFEQYRANEPIAVRIAAEILPRYGYSEPQVKFISRLILVTALDAVPADIYEQILKDADFDYLGRDDYPETALKLKEEWSVMGMNYSMHEWHGLQLRFLESHVYYTSTAQRLRGPGKQKHIQKLKEILAAEK